MIFTRRFALLVSAATLVAMPVSAAAAQALLSRPMPQPSGRLQLDGYLSQYRLALPDARARLDGVGGRVMWTLAPTHTPRRERFAEHLAIGGFVGSTAEDAVVGGSAMRTSVYGAQLDVRPLRAPLAGMIEPVISVGGGFMRLVETHPTQFRLPTGEVLVPRDLSLGITPPRAKDSQTDAILTPSVGVLVSATPDFALRVDLRRLVTGDERIGNSSELAVGVSIRL